MNETQTETKAPTVASILSSSNLPVLATKEVRKPGDLIKIDDLSPEELTLIEQADKSVNFEDSNSILLYGAGPQRQLNGFLDTLLDNVKVGDAGIAGTITLQLSEGYDLMAIEQFKDRLNGITPGMFGRLFGGAKTLAGLIKNLADQRMAILGKFEKIEKIALDRQRAIMTFNTQLDELQAQSEIYQRAMALCILGGERALLRGAGEYKTRYDALAVRKNDDAEPARLHDLARRIQSFETRLLRIKIAYVQSIAVTIPRIQAIRQAGEIEIQNIVESLLFDVPNLKALVLQVMAMTNIQGAQSEDAARRAVSQKIGDAATEMFQETYIASVQSQGRGLDDVRALAQTADKLIETLKQANTIEQENKKKRELAAAALVDVKDKVQEAMKAIRLPEAA